MKIAIYCNLEKGGALNFIIEILKNLNKQNKIDLFCFKNHIPRNLVNKTYCFKLKKTNNIFQHLSQILFELKETNKRIASIINKNNYDLILVFPCILTQSPYVLKYLKKKNNCIYFFSEPKREFYEKTSFNYYSLKKIITRLVRLPIKFIDKSNCKFAKNIISNSYFTSNNLLKIYGKESVVIYPGLKPTMPQKKSIKNNKKILSVGLLSKIKGHDFSIKQTKDIHDNITILGRKSNETNEIIKLAKKNKVFLNLISSEDEDVKNEIYKYFSIYLSNQLKEPFGITTLEATHNMCFVLGKNEGGTTEIIKNGINGLLYSNLKESRKILKNIIKQSDINFYKINEIDWKYTTNRILDYYNHYLKHEPAE